MRRQQLLFLCVANPNPTSGVTAWSFFDGSGRTSAMAGDSDTPPYPSVLAAMKDGWRVIQVPPLLAAPAGGEHATAFLRFEYVLEKLVDQDGQADQDDLTGQAGKRGRESRDA